jgi:chaperonin GroES
VLTTACSSRAPPGRGRREDRRRDHHPRHRQGKAAGGRVVAVGTGAAPRTARSPLDVKAGDRILFGKWSGTEVKIDGEDLLIMKESDILGICAASTSSPTR